MTSAPVIYCVVLHHQGFDNAARCLDALGRLDDPIPKILLVDNASKDGSGKRLQKQFPNVDFLFLGENYGFAVGNNFGIREAFNNRADFVWLLNDDTVVHPDSLLALLQAAEPEKVGAAASVLLNLDGSVQTWGGGHVSFWSGLCFDHLQSVSAERLHYLKGASLLIKTEAFSQVGLLWEELFLYWEDTDFSFRLRQAGWDIRVAEHSRVLHVGGDTVAFRSKLWDYHFTRSGSLFFRRYAPFPIWPLMISGVGRILNRARLGLWSNARAVFAALTGKSIPS